MVSSGKDYGLPARAGATKFDMDSMVHLETVSDEVCRKILTTLCNDPKIKERVFSCLWLYKDKDQKTHSIASAAQEGPSTGIDDGTKRKAEASLPDAYMCRYCGDDFLEEDNTDPEACSHHPGDLCLDEDADTWVDWPYDDDKDTDDMRDEYPGGFTWDCCDEPGDGGPGCEEHPHVALATKRQKSSDKSRKLSGFVDLTKDD